MDYLALAADAALPEYAGLSDDALAEALRPVTVSVSGQPFLWAQAKVVTQKSPNFSWSRIVVRARMTPAMPPATSLDRAILAAINAVNMDDARQIDPNDAASWAAMQAGLGALQGEGDLTLDDVAAINALTSVITQKYPGVAARDVWIARGQP
jgi:hypothetical protein